MKLPFDVPAMLDAANDINEARNLPVSVALYVDPTADAQLVGAVRQAFSVQTSHAQTFVLDFDVNQVPPHASFDLAVLIAAKDKIAGRLSFELRDRGIPVVVLTNCPELVHLNAIESGFDLPAEDVIAPDPRIDAAPDTDLDALPQKSADAGSADSGASFLTQDLMSEPYPMTVDRIGQVIRTLGEWIVRVFVDKRIAFAAAYTFVRRPLALECVHTTSLQNAGIGALFIIPGADMPLMTLNQMKMVLQIAAAFGQEVTMQRWRELAAVVGGGFALRSVARQVVPLVPVAGFALRAGIGAAGTEAIGRAAIAYFERLSGGASVWGDEQQTERMQARVEKIRSKLEPLADVARNAATVAASRGVAASSRIAHTVAPVIRDEIAPKVKETIAYVAPMAKGSAGFVKSQASPKIEQAKQLMQKRAQKTSGDTPSSEDMIRNNQQAPKRVRDVVSQAVADRLKK